MTSHTEARAAIIEAYTKVFGEVPTLLEAQFAQAVGLGESRYGDSYYALRDTEPPYAIIAKITGTNNWGAVQCTHLPPCDPANCFEATDTHENGTYYRACFRKYPTPADGAEHMIRTLYIGGAPGASNDRRMMRDAANSGSIDIFAGALRSTGYFELKLSEYIEGMTRHMQALTNALGEPMPAVTSGPKVPGFSGDLPSGLSELPTIRRSVESELVKLWQLIVGATPDGVFGPKTEAATVFWQAQHELVPDGIVGPKTWAVILLLCRHE